MSSRRNISEIAGLLIALLLAATSVAVRLRQLNNARQGPISRLIPAPGVAQQPQQIVVLFIFRPADCPSALAIIDRWNVELISKRIRVEGLVLATTSDESAIHQVVASYGIRFPVTIV